MALAVTGGCSLSLVDVQEEAPVSLQLDLLSATDPALLPILEKVEQIRLRISREGTALDIELPLRVRDGTANVRLAVVPPDGEGALNVHAELRAMLGPVFTGDAVIPRAATEAVGHISMQPVPFRVTGVPSTLMVDALGEPISIASQVQFVTGDAFPGIRPALASLTPQLVEVLDDSTIVSRANGPATLEVSFDTLSFRFFVRVAQVPTILTGLFPADTTVFVGDTVQYRLVGVDRNGHPILPASNVSWIAVGVVSADTLGRAAALSPGSSTVNAYAPNASQSTSITVLP